MNFAQLIDASWAQNGCKERLAPQRPVDQGVTAPPSEPLRGEVLSVEEALGRERTAVRDAADLVQTIRELDDEIERELAVPRLPPAPRPSPRPRTMGRPRQEKRKADSDCGKILRLLAGALTPAGTGDIARRTKVDPNKCSAYLSVLAGLKEVERHGEKRPYEYTITDVGRARI